MQVLEIIRSYERFGWFKLDMHVLLENGNMTRVTKQFNNIADRDAVKVGDYITP